MAMIATGMMILGTIVVTGDNGCQAIWMSDGSLFSHPPLLAHNNDNNDNDDTVDFRNFIVFLLGRDPGTLKSDIVSKKLPQLICSDLRLSN